MAGGMCDRGHVWQGDMHGRGCAWQGACVACMPLADTMRYGQ